MRRTGSQNSSGTRKKGATVTGLGGGGAATTISLSSSGTNKNGNRKNNIYSIDVCHNGQIPACRLLHEALQDVFPELKQKDGGTRPHQKLQQQQQQQRQDIISIGEESSSNLGRLFRRKFITIRKSSPRISFCQYSDEGEDATTVMEQRGNVDRTAHSHLTSSTTTTPDIHATGEGADSVVVDSVVGIKKNKKKRKKKKKVEGTSMSTTSSVASRTAGTNENPSTVAASSAVSNGGGEECDTRSFMDHSVEALDESVKDYDKRIKEETNNSRPSLESLPSDDNADDDDDGEGLMGRKVSSRNNDGSGVFGRRGGNVGGRLRGRRRGGSMDDLSPSRFFDQIKPQESPPTTALTNDGSTCTNENDMDYRSTHKNEGGSLLRMDGTKTTTSLASEVQTIGPSEYDLPTSLDPTPHDRANYIQSNSHHYQNRHHSSSSSTAVSPTHEQVPEDLTSTQEDDYAKGDTMKDPLQLPYLVSPSMQYDGTNGLWGTNRQSHDSGSRKCVHSNNQSKDSTIIAIREPSNLERVRLVFSEWLDQQFWEETAATSIGNDNIASGQEHNDWADFIEYCNERTYGEEKALGIPVQSLFDVAASIESEVCRTECLAEVTRLVSDDTASKSATNCTTSEGEGSSSSPKLLLRQRSSVIVLKPRLLEENPPSTSAGQEVSLEAGFDYVALEEGHHLPNFNHETTSSINNHHEDDTDGEGKIEQLLESNLSFVIGMQGSKVKHQQAMKGSNKDSRKRVLFLQKLTTQRLENFLVDWLTMGVDEDAVVSMAMKKRDQDYEEEEQTEPLSNGGTSDGGNSAPVLLSTGELHFFEKRVLEQQNDFMKSRDDMDHVKRGLTEHWDSVSKSLSTNNVNLEYAGYTVLKTCDEYCDKYVMESILPILSGQLAVPSHTFPDLQITLWSSYLGALAHTLQACDAYYENLEKLADQQGVLPKIFVCAPMRALYRDLIQDKVTVMTNLATCLTNALNDHVMKQWYTMVVWQDSNAEGASDESKSLDADFHDLLKQLTHWTAAIHGSRMPAVYRARYTQIEEALESLQSIVDPLSREYASVDQFFSRERKTYFDSLLSNIRHADGVKRRMRLIEKEDVVSLAFGAILMWRHVRIAQSSMLTSVSIPPLPLRLYHWMMLPGNPDPYDFGHNSAPCGSGWGGRRRVMCILAGLAYVWLRERCDEWKAEVAERELVTHFEAGPVSTGSQKNSDVGVTDNSEGGKSGKRKKKKKNLTGSSTADGAHIDLGGSLQNAIKSQDLSDRTFIECANLRQSSNLDSVEFGGDSLVNGSNDEDLNGACSEECFPKEIETTVDNELQWEEKQLATDIGIVVEVDIADSGEIEVADDESQDVDVEEYYDASVLVQNDEGMESARNFLIDRLVSLMNESESETTVIISR